MLKELNPKNKTDLLAQIAAAPFAVIDFFADWCGPCKQLKPQMADIASKNPNVAFYSLDVDKSAEAAKEMNIRSMPTIVFFVDGKEKSRVVGLDILGIQKNLLQMK